MKLLVETTGQFQLQDMEQDNMVISAWHPTVVKTTNFVQHRVALTQLKILGQLVDEATNEEFTKYRKESGGDTALLVSSFMAAFGFDTKPEKVEPSDEVVPEPETKAERKARIKAERAEARLAD